MFRNIDVWMNNENEKLFGDGDCYKKSLKAGFNHV